MKENLKSRENVTMKKTENMENTTEQEFDYSSKDQITSNYSRIESVAENGAYYTKDQCIKLFKRCRKVLRDIHVYEKLNSFMKYLMANPALFIGFIIVSAILIIPVALFTIFATINVAIAFSGFMIIEVLILLLGLTVLCCILFFLVSSVILIGVSFIILAYIFHHLYKLVKQSIES